MSQKNYFVFVNGEINLDVLRVEQDQQETPFWYRPSPHNT